MKSLAAGLVAAFLAFTTACAHRSEPAVQPSDNPPEHTLVGQVLLPSGVGPRGIHLYGAVTAPDGEAHDRWLPLNDQGRFTYTFRGTLTRLKLEAGAGFPVHEIHAKDLPKVDRAAGQINLGIIDVRDRLTRQRMTLREADGTPGGDVRVGMWSGPPPRGPVGESVSLGSAQFPPVILGSEVEWLLPLDAQSIYFLVERPVGPERGRNWRSGHQRLFGPFTVATFPAELVMD